jgi:hypothetical protein
VPVKDEHIVTDRFPDCLNNLQPESHSVFKAAAILVGSVICSAGEKLVEQKTVSAVRLNAVETRFFANKRSLFETLNAQADVASRQLIRRVATVNGSHEKLDCGDSTLTLYGFCEPAQVPRVQCAVFKLRRPRCLNYDQSDATVSDPAIPLNPVIAHDVAIRHHRRANDSVAQGPFSDLQRLKQDCVFWQHLRFTSHDRCKFGKDLLLGETG